MVLERSVRYVLDFCVGWKSKRSVPVSAGGNLMLLVARLPLLDRCGLATAFGLNHEGLVDYQIWS